MIVKAIEKFMEENDIEQVTLCEKAGLTEHCISLALKGKRRLSIDEYVKICTALNVPYEYFFIKSRRKVKVAE